MNIQDSYNVSVQVLEEKLLVRIRNAGSWLFSNDPITVRNKPYIQMLAIDITDEDVLTRELEESNNALKELGTELSLSISNIDQLEREREVLRMKTRIHDILGQRLSILSRLLESDTDSNNMIRSIKPLLTDLTKGLTSNIDKDPQELLSALTQSFALIGTAIHFKGYLPTNQQLAHVFTELIRECSTNAVRHGNASNVYAELQEDDKQYTLLVNNDGIPPTYPIIIGGGIEGMNRQVNEMAGELTIESEPEFHIRVTIPKN
jgi:signal transduction histidine kinase